MIRRNRTGVSVQEFEFHRAHILASGGMLLSGDDLTGLSENSFRTIRKIAELYGKTAEFDSTDFRCGTIRLPDSILLCCFNWSNTGKAYRILPEHGTLSDFWTDEPVTERLLTLPPRSARVIRQRF